MKRILTSLTIILFFSQFLDAQIDRMRFGVSAGPGIAWAKPFGVDLQKGKIRASADYGFMFEYWFTKNIGINSGLNGSFDGMNIKGRNYFELDSAQIQVRNVNEKYTFNYLQLPAYIKFKSNEIKDSRFSVWGQLGFVLNFTVSARTTFSSPVPRQPVISSPLDLVTVEKENILRKDNEAAKSISGFKSNFFDFRLGVGSGFEYRFDDKNSLLVGLFYHNGFVNNLIDRDPKKEPIVMRTMSLRVGVLF